jgi:hypothetical protein
MSSRNSGVPSPASIARADRQRVAAEQGKQAMAEIQRQANAVRANMTRLRALREAEAESVEAKPPAAPKKAKRRRVVSKSP